MPLSIIHDIIVLYEILQNRKAQSILINRMKIKNNKYLE